MSLYKKKCPIVAILCTAVAIAAVVTAVFIGRASCKGYMIVTKYGKTPTYCAKTR